MNDEIPGYWSANECQARRVDGLSLRLCLVLAGDASAVSLVDRHYFDPSMRPGWVVGRPRPGWTDETIAVFASSERPALTVREAVARADAEFEPPSWIRVVP